MAKKSLCKILFVCIALTFVNSGCTPRMTREEAVRVAVSMDEPLPALPLPAKPPRRITDILEVLNQSGEYDQKVVQELKAEASGLPPEGASDAGSWPFFTTTAVTPLYN